jgi:outer membrane protein assembly factor BamB
VILRCETTLGVLVLAAACSRSPLDVSSGAVLSPTAPAFSENLGYFIVQGKLAATDLDTRAPKWTFAVDEDLDTAPLVLDGFVYVGSSANGSLYALRAVSSCPTPCMPTPGF